MWSPLDTHLPSGTGNAGNANWVSKTFLETPIAFWCQSKTTNRSSLSIVVLDWMMLNGVNMALAMVGQEYVTRKFYEDQGLEREEINGFLGGPAFMPWQRMGNIQGSWGFENDTLYKNDWIDAQWELQGQYVYIFDLERKPCLSGSGH